MRVSPWRHENCPELSKVFTIKCTSSSTIINFCYLYFIRKHRFWIQKWLIVMCIVVLENGYHQSIFLKIKLCKALLLYTILIISLFDSSIPLTLFTQCQNGDLHLKLRGARFVDFERCLRIESRERNERPESPWGDCFEGCARQFALNIHRSKFLRRTYNGTLVFFLKEWGVILLIIKIEWTLNSCSASKKTRLSAWIMQHVSDLAWCYPVLRLSSILFCHCWIPNNFWINKESYLCISQVLSNTKNEKGIEMKMRFPVFISEIPKLNDIE